MPGQVVLAMHLRRTSVNLVLRREQPVLTTARRGNCSQSWRSRTHDAAGTFRRRDSIWNRGLIGAAIGGVGGSALIVAAHGGSDDIPRAMLNVCALPVVAGFAAGALIDALH